MINRIADKRRRRTRRGQAMVEFALVFPMFLIILFGLVEIAFFFKDRLGIQVAVLDAARALSAAGANPDSDVQAMRSITNSGLIGLNYNSVNYIKIYDASLTSCAGQPENPACAGSTYNLYRWLPISGTAEYAWQPSGPQNWPTGTRKQIDPTHIAGIEISYEHAWLNPFMHSGVAPLTMSAVTLMPLEPLCYRDADDFCTELPSHKMCGLTCNPHKRKLDVGAGLVRPKECCHG